MQFSHTAEDMHALAAEYDERFDSELSDEQGEDETQDLNPEWHEYLQEREDQYLDAFYESALESSYEL